MEKSEYNSIITIVSEIKDGIRENMRGMRKSIEVLRQESSSTKDAVVRIETRMENLVTKPDMLEEVQKHSETYHSRKPCKQNQENKYIKYGVPPALGAVIVAMYNFIVYLTTQSSPM